jgi:hypothetical protein
MNHIIRRDELSESEERIYEKRLVELRRMNPNAWDSELQRIALSEMDEYRKVIEEHK